MKLLLHMCCAPCAIYPVQRLRQADFNIMGFFYRHNIHPYTECMRRQQALETFAGQADVKVIYQKGYELEDFLRNVAYRESQRCTYCYHARLTASAKLAKRGKFDYFSTTLLYSKFQKHEQIKAIGESVGREHGVAFYYQDFRPGWKEGIILSKEQGLYRQSYCGCIYSEKERYHGPRPRKRFS